jgi:hypothetical protein
MDGFLVLNGHKEEVKLESNNSTLITKAIYDVLREKNSALYSFFYLILFNAINEMTVFLVVLMDS